MGRETLPMFGTAAILAGGKSTRMGFDKQLLMEDDRRILETVIDTLKREFADILIITARPELYEGMDVRLHSDEFSERGPLAGVHAALKYAQSRWVYLLACDMPVVNLDFVRHMKERVSNAGANICVCERNGRMEPFNTFYSRELLGDITRRLETGDSSLFRFIRANDPLVIDEAQAARFDKELRMFTNINTRSEYEKHLGILADDPEGGAALVDKLDIVRYIGGEYVPLRDLMVHETELHLEIGGRQTKTLFCSPTELRELVIGHLYTRGYIRGLRDIASLELDEKASRAAVEIVPFEKGEEDTPDNGCVFDPAMLLKNQQKFYDDSVLQKATAGTHGCALCDDGGMYFTCVDVSRHNSLDKLAGKALLGGVSLADKYILTSGRVPLDMIRKALSIRVPMIVSRSTPTIAAVEAARRANITLLGFSRENRFNIYSASHRLKGCTFPIDSVAVKEKNK